MKKLVALITTFFFLLGCSRTLINTKPTGAEVYMNGQLKGKTPYTYTGSTFVGVPKEKIVILKKEGYEETVHSIQRHTDWACVVVGVVLFFPILFWCSGYPTEYTFEMEKVLTDLPTKPQVASPEKPTTSSPVTSSTVVTVTWTSANIRSGAGNEFSVVTIVKKGDKLTVIGESGEWFNVRLENGQEGWISNRVVK